MSERLPYSFLDQAAAEAREQSRRYWAKGGEADRRFPVLPVKWPIPLVDDAEAKLKGSIERMTAGRPRRRPK